MKKLTLLCLTILTFTLLHAQKSKAVEDQKKAYAKLEEMSGENVLTKENGWMMTAKINGKVWKAESMFPQLDAAGRIIGYYKDQSISLPYRKSLVEAGRKKKFSDMNVVDMLMIEGIPIWAGKEGEMTFIKISNGWAEGSFNVNATDESGKSLKVTDGFFRIRIE